MKKEELFEAILGQKCAIHYAVEGLSDEHRVMTIGEIDNEDQFIGEDNEGLFYFNWHGATITQLNDFSFEISKGAGFVEIQLIRG